MNQTNTSVNLIPGGRWWLHLVFLGVVFSQGGRLSAPTTPVVFATVNHQRVYLSWDNLAEASLDSLTGYADFEGYRIYRSRDGGVTWGGPDDRLYDYDGNPIGWKPYAQFDLNAEEDEDHCVYTHLECNDAAPKRGIEISGADPYAPRFNLGFNTGLRHAYIDSDVVDGVEYAYTVTAYDMGLRTYSVEYTDDDGDGIYTADTTWSPSNPGHFTTPEGTGWRSLESPLGTSAQDPNFATVIPGYYASNITFPEEDNVGSFFLRQPGTIGTGAISYFIVDRDALRDELLKFEIDADLSSVAVENMAAENPYIYVYEITDTLTQLPVEIEMSYDLSGLSGTEIDSLLDLPGADSSNGMILIPAYKIKTPVGTDSDLLDGIRFRFDNMPTTMPDAVELEDIEWHADSALIEAMYFDFQYKDQTAYERRLNFDYKIEFYSTPRGDTVSNTLCTDFPTVLPFRITNLYTGKKVSLTHSDKGVPGGFPPNYELGFGDCAWTRNEEIKFTGDSLLVDGVLTPVFTFKLKIDFTFTPIIQRYVYEGQTTFEIVQWMPSVNYSQGDLVYDKAMLWVATKDNTDTEPTADFYDDNSDGVNDNPWAVQYPWEDGDYVIFRTKKFFVDGDNWIVNMSELGKPHQVTQDELKTVQVVPNPYKVHSQFNETRYQRRIRFIHLPQKCRISIYTITGELVNYFEHDDPYDGSEWWDLRTINNQEVSPGLYIYVVESGGKEHIGKFAVVR